MSDAENDAVPNGWALTTVECLAANEPAAITDGPFGSNLKSDHYTETGPRVIRLQNIGDGIFLDEKAHISESHFATLRKHEARARDVVVAMLGEELPRACIVPEHIGPAIVKADCVRLRVHPEVALPEYVMAGLNSQSLRRQAAELMHGVGRPRLGLQWFRGLRFPIAPLLEQRRIVDATESYFSRLDDAVTTLKRVERNLKRYRGSVLKAAVEGRLVPTEAALARQEGRDYEPASALLERILTDRRRRWSESGKKAKYKEPAGPDSSVLPELPEGWCWATVEQLTSLVKDGPHYSPEYSTDGIPFITGGNVRPEGVDFQNAKRITAELHDELSKRVCPQLGDILYTKGGTTGIARVNTYEIEFSVWVHVAVLRLVGPLHPFYIQHALNSPWCYAQAKRFTHGVGNQDLGLTRMINITVPLPPLVEQARIVNEVDRVHSVILEELRIVNSCSRHCQRLRQSILKWAFEGKLADQDPNDEPASVLLERIKAERDTPKPAKKKTRP